jgi:prepilin-type N-terminal cleavage/methylation domain-containing protein
MVMMMRKPDKGLTRHEGFSIIEVLIAIIIFAIGMMAMAQLQGTLTRSSANASVRTVATNIAEERIEALRGFARLSTDPANLVPAYEDIVTNGGVTQARGGINYTVTTTASDWYYDIVSDSFMGASDYFALSSSPSDLFSDYKLVSVNVAWDDTRPWLIDDSQSFTADTGITLSTVISSMTTAGNSQVATQDTFDYFLPTIDYNPGQRPDIVALTLGEGKFKESLTPEPDVYREDELVETRFDVVTYSQTLSGSLFLRREEFISVTCECELLAPPGTAEHAGRRPTVWAGDEYEEADFVNKPYGLSNLNVQTQSAFCDVCCQDHHDGGSHTDDAEAATRKYDPFPNSSREYWDSGTFDGDHKHYNYNHKGVLLAADSAGDLYVESCALVRKDGFMRVMQDFNQEGVNAFPQDFLDETSETDVYSTYVTGAVGAYAAATSAGYESSPPVLTPPATGDLDTDLWSDHTTVPLTIDEGGLTYLSQTQQLRNRGIYIGYISIDLRYVIDCLEAVGGTIDSCESGDVKIDQVGSTNTLEMLPFFEVQLTHLSRWNESPIDNPVDTTNERLVSGNLHSRGVASPEGERQGSSTVMAKGHPGNIGLTDTDPIEPNFTTTSANITVESLVGDPAFPTDAVLISGTITSSIRKAEATLVTIAPTDALCDRTPDGFICAITGANPTLKFAGYGDNTKTGVTDRTVCSDDFVKTNEGYSDIIPWKIFSLSGALAGTMYNFNVAERGSCP